MVERDLLAATPVTNANTVRIAWREMRVKIGEKFAGETVTWSMTPLHVPGFDPNVQNQ